MTHTPSLGDWLESRSESVPDELRTHIRGAVHEALQRPLAEGGVDALVRAARERLNVLLAGDTTSRSAALELLTVDALMTYALEAIASQHGEIDEDVVRMLTEIASIEPPENSPEMQ